MIKPTTPLPPPSPLASVLDGSTSHHVACERAETFIDRLPDGSVSLLTLDFPYYGVKDDAWDNAWPTPEAFIEWMGGILAKCQRVLAPNGSIYSFASADMGGRVECATRESFAVLNHIIWRKPNGSGAERGARVGRVRSYISQTERVVFAEQRGEFSLALADAEYLALCEETCGLVFEPIRSYLDRERERAGVTRRQCDDACGNQMSQRYFGAAHWALPTRENYEVLRRLFNADGSGFLARAYDDLREEHATLRKEFEAKCAAHAACRRAFNITAAVPYTDVWEYAVVQPYPGKHPCEKPEDMARDMVRASSRPGGVVADFFCGSGTFLAAAVAEGRRAIGCDMDPHWAEQAQRRCDAVKATGRIVRSAPPRVENGQRTLFV